MVVAELILIGLGAGLVGGLLGVGGSIVMIPAMTAVLGPDQHLYQSAAMIVNFFVAIPAVYQHRRAKAIHSQTVARLIPLGIVAILCGVGLSELRLFSGSGEANLRLLFGLFLFVVAGYDLYRLVRRQREDLGSDTVLARTGGWGFSAAVALPTGLIGGFFGVGGGLVAVPLQRRLLHIPIRTAVANSATLIIATSLVGAIAKNYAYWMDHMGSTRAIELSLVLIPTAILGSLCGGALTHRLPLQTIKTAFFLFLLAAALKLTWDAYQALPVH